MCGIYGFLGKPTKQTSGIIKHLGELNQARGRDSTGLAFITPSQGKIYKDAVKAEEFFKEQKAIELLCNYRKNDFLTILGHTRAASRGAVNSENAHPFKEGSIFFTHNGVINNFDDLMKEYKVDYQVDSQIIGYLLDKKSKFLDAFKELGGYFTVPYVDTKTIDTLKVAIHNNVFSYAIRGNQLYYSSDINHLKTALDNHTGFSINDSNGDTQYSFYPFNNTIAVSQDKIEAKPYYKAWEFGKGSAYTSKTVHKHTSYTGRSGATEPTTSLSDDMTQYLADIGRAIGKLSKKELKEFAEEQAYERWFDREMEKEEEALIAGKPRRGRADQVVIDMTEGNKIKQIPAYTDVTTKGGIKHTAHTYCKACKRTHQNLLGTDLEKILRPKEVKKTIFKATKRKVVFN